MLTGDTCNHGRLGKFFSAIQINQTLGRVLGPVPAGLQLQRAPPTGSLMGNKPVSCSESPGAPGQHLFS